MNPDRHIYTTTAVLAVVLATAINVLMPRDPFARTTVHREPVAASRPAEANPPLPLDVPTQASSAPQRTATSL